VQDSTEFGSEAGLGSAADRAAVFVEQATRVHPKGAPASMCEGVMAWEEDRAIGIDLVAVADAWWRPEEGTNRGKVLILSKITSPRDRITDWVRHDAREPQAWLDKEGSSIRMSLAGLLGIGLNIFKNLINPIPRFKARVFGANVMPMLSITTRTIASRITASIIAPNLGFAQAIAEPICPSYHGAVPAVSMFGDIVWREISPKKVMVKPSKALFSTGPRAAHSSSSTVVDVGRDTNHIFAPISTMFSRAISKLLE